MKDASSMPSATGEYNGLLHNFALILTGWTFFVVAIGGTVKSHEAGLSIPAPFIFGWHHDYTDGNAFWEFFHRAIVGILSVGVFTFMCLTFKLEKRPRVKKFAVVLFLLIIAQAVVGYLTVALMAHPQTSVPHAALGQSLLGMMAMMTAVTSRSWFASSPLEPNSDTLSNGNTQPSLAKLAQWNLISVFVQLLLGAALRHDDKAQAFIKGHQSVFYWHLSAHVLGAVMVSYFIARVIIRVFREYRQQPEILKPTRYIMMLLGVQLLLGFTASILKIVYMLDDHARYYVDTPPAARIWTATAHVAVGALIMLFSAVLAVRSYRKFPGGTPASSTANAERNLNLRGASA